MSSDADCVAVGADALAASSRVGRSEIALNDECPETGEAGVDSASAGASFRVFVETATAGTGDAAGGSAFGAW